VNDYVIEMEDPEAGRIWAAGLPMTLDPSARVRCAAPACGEGGKAAIEDWSERPAAEPRDRAANGKRIAPQRYPLEGLKVLDFGNFLAGPLGPMLMADLGAVVIKVESTQGDPMRWGDWAFAGCQRGKRSVALDLKSPETRPTVDALLRWADVVHHNLRRPAAKRLGLDAASVRAINPELIFCHVSSYGPSGERADWPGYDQLFQASCGWEVLGAGEGNPPMWHRFGFMDHVCAMSSALATLLGLYQRDRTGRATDVAGSLLGAGVLTNSETYLREDGTLADFDTLDSDQRAIAPGVRILETLDGWVALSSESEEAVARFCRLMGAAEPTELDGLARTKECGTVLAVLEAAGIPAEKVQQENKDAFFDDPNNQSTKLVVKYPHEKWGMFEQPGALWNFGDLETRLDRAPPLLGEHTVEVLREIGVAAETIDRLIEAGVAVKL
jgi:crotonobetainyl-CoA:carnitine CoA-transferase CaiB-like acyl-CoA transferase